ncbi:hypothetical protein BDV95DRAFT_569384 [Massariosphaeria phaeospora]|uniref:Uncharacterized protein n=1 Tax=Massariosphaeria phaeospora TaxID=100035 RepID=A0A7C8MAS4_9PLEO|nr:hypothetical protein BDV95DRAFT_569384 [Massariosphaeria phaeospora]
MWLSCTLKEVLKVGRVRDSLGCATRLVSTLCSRYHARMYAGLISIPQLPSSATPPLNSIPLPSYLPTPHHYLLLSIRPSHQRAATAIASIAPLEQPQHLRPPKHARIVPRRPAPIIHNTHISALFQ